MFTKSLKHFAGVCFFQVITWNVKAVLSVFLALSVLLVPLHPVLASPTLLLEQPDLNVIDTTIAHPSHGEQVEDQKNDPETRATLSCGNNSNGSTYQGFTPSSSTLVAVDLHVRFGGGFPGDGANATVKIRESSPSGVVLGSNTSFVTGPRMTGSKQLIRFDFPEIGLTPGSLYVIEWAMQQGPKYWSWFNQTNDPYPSGTAYGCTGTPLSDRDFNFITYAVEDSTIETKELTNTFRIDGAYSVPLELFSITTPGTLKAEISWVGNTKVLTASLTGRRRANLPDPAVPYAEVTGDSPIVLTYTVTPDDVERGVGWRLIVRHEEGIGSANGTIKIAIPYSQDVDEVFQKEKVSLKTGEHWPSAPLQDRFLANLAATNKPGLHGLISLLTRPDCFQDKRLERYGVFQQTYLPNQHAFGLVSKTASLEQDGLTGVLRSLIPLDAEDKVEPNILVGNYQSFWVDVPGEGPENYVLTDGGDLDLTVVFARDTAAESIEAILQGGALSFVPLSSHTWWATLGPNGLVALAEHDEVEWVGPGPLPLLIANDDTRQDIGVDAVQNPQRDPTDLDGDGDFTELLLQDIGDQNFDGDITEFLPPIQDTADVDGDNDLVEFVPAAGFPNYLGLTGSGITVGVHDDGVAPHLDLALVNNPVPGNGHGTHVAGIIASSGARSSQLDLNNNPNGGTPFQYRGMAPNANIVGFGGVGNHLPTNDLESAIANQSMDLVNTSLSHGGQGYSADDRDDDASLRGANGGAGRVPHVYSAGNSGHTVPQYGMRSNYFAVSSGQKNFITVGNWDSSRTIQSSIELPHSVLDGLGDVTFDAWVRSTDTKAAIISGANGAQDNEYLLYINNLDSIQIHVKGVDATMPAPNINDGDFHHIAWVRHESGPNEVYLDGVLISPATLNLPNLPLKIAANGLWLGQEQDSVGGGFNANQEFVGLIDEIDIFGRALSGAEIQAIYAAGSAGKVKPAVNSPGSVPVPADLKGWWTGDGDVQDLVGSNHGLLRGTFKPGKVGQAFLLRRGGLASTSSMGPNYDGRIKPDVVAPGSGIKSTELGTNGYVNKSGTSMASPAVAGVAALLLEAWQNTYGDRDGDGVVDITVDDRAPLPSTLKAVLIQTSEDIVDHDVRNTHSIDVDSDSNPVTGHDHSGTATATLGPDFATGWGKIDAEAAVDLILDARTAKDGAPVLNRVAESDIGHLQSWEYDFIVDQDFVNDIGQLKVTLAWDDYEGSPQLGVSERQLINDLDLVLEAPDGTVYYPWLLGQIIKDKYGNILGPEEQAPGTELVVELPIEPIPEPKTVEELKYSPNRLYINNGDGTFTESGNNKGVDGQDAKKGKTRYSHSYRIAPADTDGDNLVDFLYVVNMKDDANHLYQMDGAGNFSDIAATAGVDDKSDGRGAAWGDFDGDGDLDLYLANNGSANKLFQNDGFNNFNDVSSARKVNDSGKSYDAFWVDFLGDGTLELFLANRGSANKLFSFVDTDGDGVFDDTDGDGVADFNDVAPTAGVAGGNRSSNNAKPVDFDNDGDWDIYVSNYDQFNRLYRNDGDTDGDGIPNFTDVAGSVGVDVGATGSDRSRGFSWADYDGDGDIDLYVAHTDAANSLFRNDGDTDVPADGMPNFTDVAQAAGVDDSVHNFTQVPGWPQYYVGDVDWADYDGDGDLDLYVANWGQPGRLFKNDGDTDADGTVDFTEVGNAAGADDQLYCEPEYCAPPGSTAPHPLYPQPPGYPDGEGGRDVVWLDVDGDGDMDLYKANSGKGWRGLVVPWSGKWGDPKAKGGTSEYIPGNALTGNGVWVATKGKDHLNNVEQVVVNNPQPGHWKLRVTGFDVKCGTNFGCAQDFSVVGFPYPDLPELVVTSNEKAALSGYNEEISFSWTTKNQGADGTGIDFEYQILLSKDFYLGDDVLLTELDGQSSIGPLAAGDSLTHDSKVVVTQQNANALFGPGTSFKELLERDVFLLVRIDSDDEVVEHQEQNITFVQTGRLLDAVLVLDRSGSMASTIAVTGDNPQKIEVLRNSVNLYLDLMRKDFGDRLGIVSFASGAGIDFDKDEGGITPLTLDKADDAQAMVEDIEPGGWTNITDGLETALDIFPEQVERRRIVILFSDGKHNVGEDPVEAGTIDDLISADVQVFSVGFGVTGAEDNDGMNSAILEACSEDDCFYSDTSTQLELDKFFVNAAAGAIDAEVVVDPVGTLLPGDNATVGVVVNSQDSMETFIVTWDNPGAELELTLRSPSGLLIGEDNHSLFGENVSLTVGATHKFLSVRFPISSGASQDHNGLWEMLVTNSSEKETSYTASVIAKSTIKALMPTPKSENGQGFMTGDPILLEVNIHEAAGSPITEAVIRVTPTTPSTSLGTLLSTSLVTTQEIGKVPEEVNGEPLSYRARFFIALQDKYGDGNPALPKKRESFELEESTAGEYTGAFNDTRIEGVYEFLVQVEGLTSNCEPFRREITRSVIVRPRVDPALTTIVVSPPEVGEITIVVSPRDSGGNVMTLNPGRDITISSPGATAVGRVINAGDGTYSQRFKPVKGRSTTFSVQVQGIRMADLIVSTPSSEIWSRMGDVDGDATTGMTDVVALLRLITQQSEGGRTLPAIADVFPLSTAGCGDGKVNIFDAVLLLRAASGLVNLDQACDRK